MMCLLIIMSHRAHLNGAEITNFTCLHSVNTTPRVLHITWWLQIQRKATHMRGQKMNETNRRDRNLMELEMSDIYKDGRVERERKRSGEATEANTWMQERQEKWRKDKSVWTQIANLVCFYSCQIRRMCVFSSATWTITSRCLRSPCMRSTWMRMLTWAPPSSQSALTMKMKVGEDEDDG